MKFEVREGSFQYTHEKEVLKKVSFSLEGPEILSILGANGAGKTTLLKCMLGLLTWSSGATFLDDVNIKNITHKEFWKRVGYVPQAKKPSFVYSVREMVVLGRNAWLREWQRPGKRDWEKVGEALALLGISHLQNRLCNQISGGEYQLVLIARALAAEPSLLVLDEPESNLDFKNQTIVLEAIRRLCREKGISAILNTHYPEHAIDISQKALLLMPEGSTVFGRAEEILREELLEKAFDVPVLMRKIQLPGREYTCVFPSPLPNDKEEPIR